MTVVSPYLIIGAPITSKSLSSNLSLIASSLDCLKRNVVAAMLASGCRNCDMMCEILLVQIYAKAHFQSTKYVISNVHLLDINLDLRSRPNICP